MSVGAAFALAVYLLAPLPAPESWRNMKGPEKSHEGCLRAQELSGDW